ncbi:Uncharacterized protein ChrSV_3415 [Chromobacterium vaccinii]|nr:Uncharacterized protein ChrSW_3415 [Chromobacterium vaccinii]QND90872.1 Uncharacterized protein ChrSV_3415 [Chromobacterium vaccinii]
MIRLNVFVCFLFETIDKSKWLLTLVITNFHTRIAFTWHDK